MFFLTKPLLQTCDVPQFGDVDPVSCHFEYKCDRGYTIEVKTVQVWDEYTCHGDSNTWYRTSSGVKEVIDCDPVDFPELKCPLWPGTIDGPMP